MINDPGIPEDELKEALEQFSSDYRVGMSQGLKRFLEEWGLEDGPEQLRVEKRLLPILERSLAEIVDELERAIRPLVDSSGD